MFSTRDESSETLTTTAAAQDPSPSSMQDMESVWRQRTDKILEYPVGTLPSSLLGETHMTILFWLENNDSESVRQPLLLLERLFQEEQVGWSEGQEAPTFYDTNLLNLILNHWRKLLSENVTLKAVPEAHPQALVDTLIRYHESADATNIRPDTQTFAMIMDGIASLVTHPRQTSMKEDLVLIADDLIRWIVQEAPSHPHMRPNVFTFSSLMNVWVKSKSDEAPERVEELLDEMQDLHDTYPEWEMNPNQWNYATAIDAWAKVGRVDRVEDLLGEMHEEYKAGAEELKPNIMALNGYVVALARVGRIDEAEQVLLDMEDLYAAGELDDRPNVISYSTVLDAFAKSRAEGTAARAEAILRRMKDKEVEANTISWNTVIDAYVKENNLAHAEELLREMNDEFLQGNRDVKPTMRSYSIVLSGLSRMRSAKAAERGEQLLELMKRMSETGELEKVDLVAHNSVLACWAKSRSTNAGAKSKQFLEKMIQDGQSPDAYSFNIVISALTREGKRNEAEKVLEDMVAKNVQPNTITYNTLLYAWIKSDDRQSATRVRALYKKMSQDEDVKPDLFTLNTMLHFFSRNGDAKSAEAMLEEACLPDSKVEPDSISFNTVISAWTKSNDNEAPERAEEILEKMLHRGGNVQPNTITFNSLLNVWVKRRPNDAAEKCKQLVEKMHQLVQSGHPGVKPDAITYNTVINALGKKDDEQSKIEAEQIFREMDRRYRAGEKKLKPTVHTFGSLLYSLSKSHASGAATKADEILRMWIDRADNGEIDQRPRVDAFTAVIAALKKSDDPQYMLRVDETLFLLLKEFEQGNEKARPDSKLFSVVLAALATSSIQNKGRIAQRIIELMKRFRIKPDKEKTDQLRLCFSREAVDPSNVA